MPLVPCRYFQKVAPAYKVAAKKNCFQEVSAEKSIFVVSTDPSETFKIKGA